MIFNALLCIQLLMIIIDWNIRLQFIIFGISNMTQARQESALFYHVFHEQ